MAHGPVARGFGRVAVVALRPRARSGRTEPALASASIITPHVHRSLRIPGLREGGPSGRRRAAPFQTPALPEGYRPGGSLAA